MRAIGPVPNPIGLQLARASRTVGRAFDEALGEAGGSLPAWLVLLSIKTGATANQRELARAVGVSEATLTHHLNAMEVGGLLTRTRDRRNRRVHVVALTDAGEQAFVALRAAAIAFDRRLRRGVDADQLAACERVLELLVANVAGELAQESSMPSASDRPA